MCYLQIPLPLELGRRSTQLGDSIDRTCCCLSCETRVHLFSSENPFAFPVCFWRVVNLHWQTDALRFPIVIIHCKSLIIRTNYSKFPDISRTVSFPGPTKFASPVYINKNKRHVTKIGWKAVFFHNALFLYKKIICLSDIYFSCITCYANLVLPGWILFAPVPLQVRWLTGTLWHCIIFPLAKFPQPWRLLYPIFNCPVPRCFPYPVSQTAGRCRLFLVSFFCPVSFPLIHLRIEISLRNYLPNALISA